MHTIAKIHTEEGFMGHDVYFDVFFVYEAMAIKQPVIPLTQ